jgi:hypothetical protein
MQAKKSEKGVAKSKSDRSSRVRDEKRSRNATISNDPRNASDNIDT